MLINSSITRALPTRYGELNEFCGPLHCPIPTMTSPGVVGKTLFSCFSEDRRKRFSGNRIQEKCLCPGFSVGNRRRLCYLDANPVWRQHQNCAISFRSLDFNNPTVHGLVTMVEK